MGVGILIPAEKNMGPPQDTVYLRGLIASKF